MEPCCDTKGFLSFLVLRLIKKNPMSGKELRKELGKRRGSNPSAGTIYPVLKSLTEKGLIEELHEGTKEKKYKITKKGHKEIQLVTEKFLALFYDMKEDFRKC